MSYQGLDELLVELLFVGRGPYCLLNPVHLQTSFAAIEVVTQRICEACVPVDNCKVIKVYPERKHSRGIIVDYIVKDGCNQGFFNDALMSFANIIFQTRAKSRLILRRGGALASED